MATVKYLALIAVLTAACGDAQIDRQFRGVPIWRFEGGILTTGTQPAHAAALRMALFWSPHGLQVVDPEQWVEQTGTTIPVAVPSNYVLNVFETPGPEHMLRLPDGTAAGYTVGRLAVYVDENGDGQHTAGEPLVGLDSHSGFYYFGEVLPADRRPTRTALAAGFYQAFLPQPCGFVPPPPTDAATCGIPIGSACAAHADCAGGLCLLGTSIPRPVGYCTTTTEAPSGCRPAAAAYLGSPRFGRFSPLLKKGFYLKSCTTDASCRRVEGREQDIYGCDLGLGGCVPLDAGGVQVGGPFQVEPFCTGPP